jgi:hypothetical protein
VNVFSELAGGFAPRLTEVLIMLTTSWPAGSALPRPRKRRKRPPSKAARAERRIESEKSRIARDGEKFVPLAMRGIYPAPESGDGPRCGKCKAITWGRTHACALAHVDTIPEIPTAFQTDAACARCLKLGDDCACKRVIDTARGTIYYTRTDIIKF